MSDTRSTLWSATDALLRSRHGVGLDEWLRNKVETRAAAHPRGHADWRAIARDLSDATGGVAVSHEALRQWWIGTEREGASA